MSYDPNIFRQVAYIGIFTGLIIGLSSALLGVAIEFLYQKIRKIS